LREECQASNIRLKDHDRPRHRITILGAIEVHGRPSLQVFNPLGSVVQFIAAAGYRARLLPAQTSGPWRQPPRGKPERGRAP